MFTLIYSIFNFVFILRPLLSQCLFWYSWVHYSIVYNDCLNSIHACKHVTIHLCSFVQLGTSVQCDLLNYRNLNMIPFLEEAGIEATFEAHWGQDVSCLIDLGAMEFRVGQGSIHTLNMALQAWTRVRKKFSWYKNLQIYFLSSCLIIFFSDYK